MRLSFFLKCKKVDLKKNVKKKKKKKKNQRRTYLMMLLRCFLLFFLLFFLYFFSPNFLYKSIRCGYSFELHRQVHAIQMSTHSICIYNEVDKKHACCHRKTTELLDCAFIGVCAVSRSKTVLYFYNGK